MSTPRHLRNAPITEALIDIRVPAKSSVTSGAFEDLRSALQGDYPVVAPQQIKEATVRIEGGKLTASTSDVGVQGLRFSTADGKTLIQLRSDGFTLNRLKPYTSWAAIFPEFIRLWPLYVERANPEGVTRIALRYINRLSLPIAPNEDYGEFLTSAPTIPPELPQFLSSFLTRVVIHHETSDPVAIVTQSLGSRVVPDERIPVLLDIDVSMNRPFSVDPTELSVQFETLHRFKNDVFFSFLTERTVRLFE